MIKTVVCVFLVSLLRLSAQTQQASAFHHQIGAAVTTTIENSNYGVCYQVILSEKYKLKLTGFYESNESASFRTSSDDRDFDTDMLFYIDIEGQKTLYKNTMIRFYGLLSLGYQNRTWESISQFDSTSEGVIGRSITGSYTGGPGLGIEMVVFDRFSLSLDARFMYSFEERNYTITSTSKYASFNNKTTGFNSAVNYGIGGGFSICYQF